MASVGLDGLKKLAEVAGLVHILKNAQVADVDFLHRRCMCFEQSAGAFVAS